MKKTGRQEKGHPPMHKPSLVDKARTGWAMKHPVFLFVLGFFGLMFLFYIFWVSTFFKEQLHPTITHFYASISSMVLNIFSQGTTSSGTSIVSSSFSISVAAGCDAIEATALFVAAVLAFPSAYLSKIPGIFLGILFLMLLNIVRIVSLF